MGIETDWKLEVHVPKNEEEPDWEDIFNIIEGGSGYEGWWDRDGNVFTMTAKWYDFQDHMPLISKQLEGYTLILNGVNEMHERYPVNQKWLDGVEVIKSKKQPSKGKQALKVKVQHPHDGDKEITLKAYLKLQLGTLWNEKECFSGKRPFGDSDWDYQVYESLIKSGLVTGGILDDDGYIKELGDAEDILIQAIEAL